MPATMPMAAQMPGTGALLQRLNTATEQTYLLIARVAEQLGERERALRIYDSLLSKNAYSLPTLLQCAQLHRHAEQFDQAIHYFNLVKDLDPNNGEAHAALGHCYLMMDELQQAYTHYQLALQHLPNPKDPKLWYGIGILYDRYGSYDHAEEAFAAAIRMDATFDKVNEIYFRLGIIYKQTMRGESALQCFRYIMQNPPKPLNELDIYFQIGHCYEQMKDYHAAKEAYEHVLSVDPKHAKVLQQFGWLYHTPGTEFHNEDLAIQSLEKSVESDPNDAQTWYLLGRCHMTHKRYNQAHDAYQQAVYRDPKNPTFWCSIGVLYFQIRQYRDALEAYSRAIRLNPYLSEVWFDLGTLYESCNNQLHDALDAYDRAAGLDPNNPHIQERLRIVKEVMARGGTTTQGLSNGAFPEEIQNSMSLGGSASQGPSSSTLLGKPGPPPPLHQQPPQPQQPPQQQQQQRGPPSPHLAQIQVGPPGHSAPAPFQSPSTSSAAPPSQRSMYQDHVRSPTPNGVAPMQVDPVRHPLPPQRQGSNLAINTSAQAQPSQMRSQPYQSPATQAAPPPGQPGYYTSRGPSHSQGPQSAHTPGLTSPPTHPTTYHHHTSTVLSPMVQPQNASAPPSAAPLSAAGDGPVARPLLDLTEASVRSARAATSDRPLEQAALPIRPPEKPIDPANPLGITTEANGSQPPAAPAPTTAPVQPNEAGIWEAKNVIHYTSATAMRRPSDLLQKDKEDSVIYRRQQIDDDYDAEDEPAAPNADTKAAAIEPSPTRTSKALDAPDRSVPVKEADRPPTGDSADRKRGGDTIDKENNKRPRSGDARGSRIGSRRDEHRPSSSSSRRIVDGSSDDE
ncbi:glucose repression mediator protein [Sorochytrium milnesiophthora]